MWAEKVQLGLIVKNSNRPKTIEFLLLGNSGNSVKGKDITNMKIYLERKVIFKVTSVSSAAGLALISLLTYYF